ncbi:MAG: LysE family translocator [Pseudomonadota bacterium]
MSIETYLSYLVVVFVFFATPPDTSQLLMISNSLRHGVKNSMATVAGDLTANTIQMAAAAFGLAAVVSVSAEFFQIIKWLGVAYLVYLGFRLITSKTESNLPKYSEKAQLLSLYQQGFVTSSANPFAIVFFAALFPQFIDQSGNIVYQLIILGGTYLIIDGVVLVLWGIAAARTLSRIKQLKAFWINRVCGGLMILAALYLANNDLSEGYTSE